MKPASRCCIFTKEVETLNINYIARVSDRASNELKPGMKVGVIFGSAAQEYLRDCKDIVIVPSESLQHLLMGLLSGQTDLILAPAPNVMRLAMEAGIEDRFRVIEPPVQEGKRAMALRPGNEALEGSSQQGD